MKLPEFIRKNKVTISCDYNNLCIKGIELMKKSVDKHHSDIHVYGLLDELHKFIDFESSIDKEDLDFEILLPAICWHDVWKSTKNQTNRILTLIFEQIYEGFGSTLMFEKETKNLKLEKARAISRLILFHPGYEFLPGLYALIHKRYKSKELLILNDLDRLDSLNVKRLRDYAGRYMKKGNTSPKLFRIAYFWIKNVTLKKNSNNFHFTYSKNQFEINKRRVIRKAVSIFGKLTENKDYYFDMSKPDAKYIRNFQPSEADEELLKLYAR